MVRSKGLALAAAAACAAVAGGGWARAAGPERLIPATASVPAAHAPSVAAQPLMMDVPAAPDQTAGPSLKPTPAPDATGAGGSSAAVGTSGQTNTGTGVSTPPANPTVGTAPAVTTTPPPPMPAPMPAPVPPADTTPTSAPTSAPTTDAATTPSSTPLMRLLEGVGPNGGVGKALEDAGISITGFVEGSYTYDFSSPPGNVLTDRAFDQRHDSPILDQVELLASRSVDYTKPIDFGFTVEQIYGVDSTFIHANGLTLMSNGKIAGPFAGTGNVTTVSPRAQYDPTQAFFQISSNAVAKGIAFEGGKFATLLGAELIDAYSASGSNAFYSHSFIFINEPYTHTGALGIINFNEAITFTGGITRGWDQATEDTNGNIDFIGQLKYVLNPKATVFLNGISGNEEPDTTPGTVGHNGWRTVFDVVGTYQATDQLSFTANGMYAWEGQTGNLGDGGGLGQWYAVAGYASYKVADFLTLNGRAEWFNDPDGAAPTQFTPLRRPNEYYEFTLGTTIHPFPNTDLVNNFFIRPEVRFDYADKASFDTTLAGPTDHYFFSFGVDGVYAF